MPCEGCVVKKKLACKGVATSGLGASVHNAVMQVEAPGGCTRAWAAHSLDDNDGTLLLLKRLTRG